MRLLVRLRNAGRFFARVPSAWAISVFVVPLEAVGFLVFVGFRFFAGFGGLEVGFGFRVAIMTSDVKMDDKPQRGARLLVERGNPSWPVSRKASAILLGGLHGRGSRRDANADYFRCLDRGIQDTGHGADALPPNPHPQTSRPAWTPTLPSPAFIEQLWPALFYCGPTRAPCKPVQPRLRRLLGGPGKLPHRSPACLPRQP